MSLESAIADLVSASTSLVSAVNVTKTTIEATEAAAAAQVQPTAAAATEAQTQASAAATSASTVSSKLTTAAADYAAQKVTKGLAAVQTAADTELKDRLHRRDPARHPFRGARPSLVMDFVRRECHRNNAAGNLEPVDLNSFMTFTRASTATVVGPDGLIKEVASNVPRYGYDPVTGEALGLLVEEQRTNLFPYSSYPASASAAQGWNRINCDVYPNVAVAPDGTMTAAKAVVSVGAATTGNDGVGVFATPGVTSSATHTLTLYVKDAGAGYLRIRESVNTGQTAKVNLTTGAITAEAGYTTTTFTVATADVGNGWWRVVVVRTPTTTFGFNLKPGIDVGNGVSGIYVWGAQLEDGSFPTSYIPTPATFTGRASTKTYFDSNGVMQTAANDVAVTDHGYVDGRWVSKGLSLEPQATNLALQSDTATPLGTVATVELNVLAAPDGTITADKLVATSATQPRCEKNIAVPATDTQYTYSFFAKRGSNDFVSAGHYSGVSSNGAIFNLATCSVVSTTGAGCVGRIVPCGNGWFRCSITFNVLATSAYNYFKTIQCEGVAFDMGTVGGYVYLWGFQIETGPVATSYIPTTTAQVTRAADTSTSAQVTRASDVTTVSYAASPIGVGTVNVVHDRISNLIGYILEVNTGGVDNSRLVCRSNGSTSFRVFNIRTLLTTPSQDTDVTNIAARSAFALSYSGVGCKTSRGGGVVKSLPSIESAHASVFNTIRIGWTSGNISNGYIRQLTYFPRQLSDADLQALTILED